MCVDGTTLENCHIITLNRTTYRVNPARAEVIYVVDSGLDEPRKLVDCAVMSRADWACSYPDGSAVVSFRDGREMRNARDRQSHWFYMRKWQWWYVQIAGNFTWPVTGSLLIPEQHDQMP